jgi:hypothetical protein
MVWHLQNTEKGLRDKAIEFGNNYFEKEQENLSKELKEEVVLKYNF